MFIIILCLQMTELGYSSSSSCDSDTDVLPPPEEEQACNALTLLDDDDDCSLILQPPLPEFDEGEFTTNMPHAFDYCSVDNGGLYIR